VANSNFMFACQFAGKTSLNFTLVRGSAIIGATASRQTG